jgi:predicted MFS family arabinose efflux permease
MDRNQAPGNAPLYWMALGTFAVGTESFMIAGLLPGMARDLAVSTAAAGQLVTVFALAYAISSPVLTALTGRIGRRALLIGAMTIFAAANLLAWQAASYWQLMAARVLLAFAAGLYVPGANAVASAVVAPERRGTAIAIVNGGLSLAIAFGVPLGALLGEGAGWRATFAAVAGLAALAALGLTIGLPQGFGAHLKVPTLAARLQAAAQPAVLSTLLVTTLWAMASYTTYTYLALLIGAATGIEGGKVGGFLFAWGAAAALGLAIAASRVDRHGPQSVIVPSLLTSTAAFIVLSASALALPPKLAVLPMLAAIVAWGVAHWAFYPAQQTRLVGVAGVAAAPIVLSLNASFMYAGFSLGAAFGSLTITALGVANIGFASALCMAAALALSFANARRFSPSTTPA